MRLPHPFRNPLLGTSFRWLLWSDALTLLAMMVGAVALPWWIAQSGGAHDLSVYGVLVSAMSFVALPLLSPFADRHSKRSLMTVGLLGFAIATSAMAAFATLAHYRLAVVVAIVLCVLLIPSLGARGAAIVTFENVEVGADAVLGEADKGFALLEKVLDRARAGLSAEMLGSAIQAFETTLDYLKTRVQFGQVIGSFQALQHRAAKMFTDLELARSTVEAALAAIDADSPDVPELVSLAKAKMGDTFHLVSNEMVQMHGGIGMTDAHDAGLYLKRARAAEATYGGQSYHRDRYARINGY